MEQGQLAEHQRDVAWCGKDADERREMTAVNLTRSGMAEAAGVIATNADASGERQIETEKKKREEAAEAARRQLLEDLEKHRADLLDQLAALREDMAKLQEEMDAADRRLKAMSGAIGQLEAGEDLDRNADGSPKDDDLEAALKNYEERTGKSVGRNDPETLLMVLRDQQQYEHDRQNQRRNDYDDKQKREEELERDLDQTDREIAKQQSAEYRADISLENEKAASLDKMREMSIELNDLTSDPTGYSDDDIFAELEADLGTSENELNDDRVADASKAIAQWDQLANGSNTPETQIADIESTLEGLHQEVEFLASQEGTDSPAARYLEGLSAPTTTQADNEVSAEVKLSGLSP